MKTIRLVGILLMVFVKSKYQRYVTEVDAETVATGIMGLMVRPKIKVLVIFNFKSRIFYVNDCKC